MTSHPGPGPDGGVSGTFLRLCLSPPGVLLGMLARGGAPDPSGLSGWEFRACWVAGSLPALGGARHRRGFYRVREDAPGGPALAGYTVACHRGGLGDPWVDRLRGPGALRRGWFLVLGEQGGRFPRALVLDYSRAGRASRLQPLRFVREHLVQARPDDPDVLLVAREIRVGGQVRHLGVAVLERHMRGTLPVRGGRSS